MLVEQKNIPSLRFPEFEGAWEEKKLEEIADVKGGKRIPKGMSLTDVDTGQPYITVSNMENGSVNLDKIKFVPDEAKHKIRNYKILISDIFISVAGTLGLIGIIPQELNNANLTENANKLTNIKCVQAYLLRYLETSYFSRLIENVKTTNAQPKLAIYALQSFKVRSPHENEQQKIAEFLTAVDGKIGLLSKKKDLAERYKKGVMQKLFSQSLRFTNKDGTPYPDWEEKTLGEISEKPMYGMNAAARQFDGENKYIRITDIDEDSRKFVPKPLTSPQGEILDKYYLKVGDIVFARTGASVGKSYLYKEFDGQVAFAGFLIKFSISGANESFVFSQTLTYAFKKWVKVMSMRSGQPGINAEEYQTFSFQLPSQEEQQKIADFLSSLDQKITHISQQLTQAQAFKKGLLQQMFV
ncbi:MAG: restriction endonuclease subunit S [Alphaproteobacteria bacterium]|nr:MAG: restriction endonuclease subunit S [Alphaproteobacteria bacterium]